MRFVRKTDGKLGKIRNAAYREKMRTKLVEHILKENTIKWYSYISRI